MQYGAVSFDVAANSSTTESRTGDIIFEQDVSGKQITLRVTQDRDNTNVLIAQVSSINTSTTLNMNDEMSSGSF